MQPGRTEKSSALLTYGLAITLVAALIASPSLRGHIDDPDAPIYHVLARNMLLDRTWFDLRLYTEEGPWRDHLPFGLWPFAAAIHLMGEHAIPFVAASCALVTIALVGWVGHGLAGRSAGLIAMLVLGTHTLFFLYAARSRLDPILMMFATAAAAPLFVRRIEVKHWVFAALLGAAATLVKGPFGLLPLVSAIGARAILQPCGRVLVLGIGAILLAVVPVALFLLQDKWMGKGTWWNGYFLDQIVASATGTRNGSAEVLTPWYPLSIAFPQIFPGVPVVLLSLWFVLTRKGEGVERAPVCTLPSHIQLRMLCLLCLFMFCGLLLPARKILHHALIVVPWLAILAGAGVGPQLDRWLGARHLCRMSLHVFLAGSVVLWAVVLAGKGPRYPSRPCIFATELRQILDNLYLRYGETVWVIGDPLSQGHATLLAAERRVSVQRSKVFPLHGLPTDSLVNARVALVRENGLPADLGGWQELGRARGWVLLQHSQVGEQ